MGAAAGWTAVLLIAWRATVAQALVTPIYRSAGLAFQARRRRRVGQARSVPACAGPNWPRGRRLRARLRAWRGDPRYISGLTAVVLLPALFVAVVIPAFNLDPRWALAAPFVLAISIGWGRHNDVAYDSSALWMDIVAGQRGGAGDARTIRRRGGVGPAAHRSAAACATSGWAGHWELAPAIVGAAVGALGTSLAVSAITSVLLPYRTPAPGENPFGAEVGSVGAGFVGQLASSGGHLPVAAVGRSCRACSLSSSTPGGAIVAAVGGIGIGSRRVHLRPRGGRAPL